jgi:AAA family ATP:ADP antiporter
MQTASQDTGERGPDDDHRYFISQDSLAERRSLLPISKEIRARGVSIRRKQFDQRLRNLLTKDNQNHDDSGVFVVVEWLRPLWLGCGLFLLLCAFWILDSLKDPVFAALIDGNLEEHQPSAKLFSVFVTLGLVGFLEYVAEERRRQQQQQQRGGPMRTDENIRNADEILDAGGTWSRMSIHDDVSVNTEQKGATEDRVPSSIFASIGIPYCIFFGITAYLLQFNPATAYKDGSPHEKNSPSSQVWYILGFIVFAAIESFGSLAVATFWSYTNSTLSLHDAERYYGTIIAFAQLGAIAGSTMVTIHVWNAITLFITACLVLILHILTMITYARRFPPTSKVLIDCDESAEDSSNYQESSYWSGIHLILKHNYVLLILGVSCLYEVSLTCLNYQMTLLGWSRFQETEIDPSGKPTMSFTQFMGHYGQMVNIISLVLSSIVFPFFMHRLGLRLTLRLFPTLLLIANIVAFGALPGNLPVLFLSLSLLKAMTYSIHDPAKEILYIPTSNAIKFKSKFWIDVVGARFAKAIGSSINKMSGSVHGSIRVASAPSLLTAAALWYVCYRVGGLFDELVATDTIVGVEIDPRLIYKDHSADNEDDDNEDGNVHETMESVELTAF